MSWYINYAGEREPVIDAVKNNPTVPESVKNVIIQHIQMEDAYYKGVKVSGNGHLYTQKGDAQSSINNLCVEPFEILLKQSEVPALQPPTSSAPSYEEDYSDYELSKKKPG